VLLRPGAALQVRADHAVAALNAAAVGRGAVVRHRSPVLAVEALDDERVEVRTASGRIRARRAIVTAPAPAGPRGVELHFTVRPGAGPAAPLTAHHDGTLGLARTAPCAQGHLAVGAASWPRGTVGDLCDHVRTWFPGVDPDRPEPVGPSAMSTVSPEVSVARSGAVVTATTPGLGSVLAIAQARVLVEATLAGSDGRRHVS